MTDPAHIEECIASLPEDVQSILAAQLLGSRAGNLNYADARATLQLVLAKAKAKGMPLQHMAWPSLGAAIALLAATDKARLEARARCGFSHRELYWSLDSMDLYNYSCGGVTGARRFGRCLPCAIGKPGKCGASSAAWFCRRRLAVLDTRDMPCAHKTASLLMGGVTLLPSRSAGYILARGLDANGKPQGPSRKTVGPPPGPQDDDRVSLFDRSTWSGARLAGRSGEDKSETFVAQARTLLDSLQGLTPDEQWHEVNDACTKRYVGCLKRLAGKDSRKRKLAQAGAEAPPLEQAQLAASELKRWPDYAFLMGAAETDGCLTAADREASSCFLNDATRAAAAEMQPSAFGMPPWHLRPIASKTMRARSGSIRRDASPPVSRQAVSRAARSLPRRAVAVKSETPPPSFQGMNMAVSVGQQSLSLAEQRHGQAWPESSADYSASVGGSPQPSAPLPPTPSLSQDGNRYGFFARLNSSTPTADAAGCDPRWSAAALSGYGDGTSDSVTAADSAASALHRCGLSFEISSACDFNTSNAGASALLPAVTFGGGGTCRSVNLASAASGNFGGCSANFGACGANFGVCGGGEDTSGRNGALPPAGGARLYRRSCSWESESTGCGGGASAAARALEQPNIDAGEAVWTSSAHAFGMGMPICPPGTPPEVCYPVSLTFRQLQTQQRHVRGLPLNGQAAAAAAAQQPQHPYGRSKRQRVAAGGSYGALEVLLPPTAAALASHNALTTSAGGPTYGSACGGGSSQLTVGTLATADGAAAAAAAAAQKTPTRLAHTTSSDFVGFLDELPDLEELLDAAAAADGAPQGVASPVVSRVASRAASPPATTSPPFVAEDSAASAPAADGATGRAAGVMSAPHRLVLATPTGPARQDSFAAVFRQDSNLAGLLRQDSLAALLRQSSLGKLFRQESLQQQPPPAERSNIGDEAGGPPPAWPADLGGWRSSDWSWAVLEDGYPAVQDVLKDLLSPSS